MVNLSNNRIFYIDFIRTFAILCIISCHVFADLVLNMNTFNTEIGYYSLFFNSLRELGIPLFVVISGALLIGRKDSITTFAKKRIVRVMIPYIFWTLIYLAFIILCMQHNLHFQRYDMNALISSTLTISPSGPSVYLWFIPMILTVYIIIAIINEMIKINYNSIHIFLIASIILIILFNLNVITPKGFLRNVFYSVFAVLGCYLSRIDLNRSLDDKKLALVFLAIAVITYIVEIYFNQTTTLMFNRYYSIQQFNFINVACVISIFLFFKYLSKSNNDFSKLRTRLAGKIILSISMCSYGIYLCHTMIKIGLTDLLKPLNGYTGILIFTTLIFILTIICSWLLILGMSKIPVLNKFSGAK